jgi:hypothetical protein
MNWEAVGAIGEIVGAAAVVATLVYLAVQIRQSSKIASLQASQHVLEGAAELQARIAEDEDLRRIFASGCRSYDSLEGGDRRRFYAIVGEYLMRYEVQTQMHEAGMLNDDNFAAATRGVVRLLSQPGARDVCERAIAAEIPSDRFKKIVASLLGSLPRS